MKKGFTKTFFLLALSLVLLAGCGEGATGTTDGTEVSEAGSDEGSSSSDKVVIAVNQNIITMDPHNNKATNTWSPILTVYEGLIEYDDSGEIQNVLAEDYSVNDDGTEYTFQLREDVVFHDGTPFNGEAVKVNMDRLADESNGLLRNSDFAYVEKTEVVSEYEVKVTLEKPYSSMLDKFAKNKMISPQALEEYGDDIERNPVGTGPFEFEAWESGNYLEVHKFDDYWQEGLPKEDAIQFKPVPEDGTRVAMLKTGEADFIYPYPSTNFEDAENQDAFEVVTSPSVISNGVMLNTTKKPFDDKRVRQALNYAINKEAFIDVVRSGVGVPMDSIIPQGTRFYEEQDDYAYDPEKAKALLEEAGYGDGVDIEMWGNTTSTNLRGMQFIQQQLADVGINLSIESMEDATLNNKIFDEPDSPEDSTVQMWYVSWSQSPGDTDAFIRPAFSSDNFPPEGVNVPYYKNDEVDDLIQEAVHAADEEEQAALYAQIQSIIYEDAPWMFLYVDEMASGVRSNVDGIYMYPSGIINVREVEVN